MAMRRLLSLILLTTTMALVYAYTAWALQPPEPGMLEEMAAEGTLQDALRFAEELGNHELKPPRRGALNIDEYSPEELAEMIQQNLGRSLDAKSSSAIGKMTSRELDWVELDLNRDRVVDERDLLVLGHTMPKSAATLPSLGTTYMFCLIIEFPDYPGYFTHAHFDDMIFGDGDSAVWYKGLHAYYDTSSYSQLNIDGEVYGWYEAQHDRAYYHPNDNESYPDQTAKRQELIWEAISAADDAGEDFSIYDNDGDGVIDEFCVVWTGPHGAWATFWWGYHTGWSGTQYVDGVRLGNYSWQWERYYGFSQNPPEPSRWDTSVLIHETGHGLGLPDWYDYDGNQGPDGGVGGLDIMHGSGDHGCYNKYLLGWVDPVIAYTNLDDELLNPSHDFADAVLFMPGFDPVTPWSEFFMLQNRRKQGLDTPTPGNGMLLWHIDANINEGGGSLWNNSYTSHKHLRLMEADGLEEIETGNGQADAGDYYNTGAALTPSSTPNSNDYDGNDTGISVDDFVTTGDDMTCDITMFSSNPPTVSITYPSAGMTMSGTETIEVSASDDSAVDRIQLFVDGQLVHDWDGADAPFTWDWNTRVDFNTTVDVMVRAWDDGDQSSSDSVAVTVSNPGVVSTSDDFESGLDQWRVVNDHFSKRGQFTYWDTRTTPDVDEPLGSGKEAFVRPTGDNGDWHNARDYLRSERIDATGYTFMLMVEFYYRSRSGFSLWATTDDGSTWTKLDDISASNGWTTFTQLYNLQGEHVYLELRYTGNVRNSTAQARGANIDDILIQEAPSDPPTVTITSHTEGDTVSGEETFTATASDDGAVASVKFYLRGSLRHTDDSTPFEYTRDTLSDDNHPAIELKVIATDDDGLPSSPDAMDLVWNNDRPFPAQDDLEGGMGDWSFQNDTKEPDWTYVSGAGYGGGQCMAWVTEDAFEAGNSEGLWYHGEAPASGRKCVNLAHADVVDPVIRFKYKGDPPTSLGTGLYLHTTWEGYKSISGWSADSDDWTYQQVDLSSLVGYSGRICWWLWSGNDTSGSGIWIDDVEIINTPAHLESISPSRGVVGDTITITGSGFGSTQDTSNVRFPDGVMAPPEDILSWSDTEIQVNIPTGAISGDLVVVVDDIESNWAEITVVLPAPSIGDLDQI